MPHEGRQAELTVRSSSPEYSADEIAELFQRRKITMTPRLGNSDGSHSNGYAVGERVRVRVRDEMGNDLLEPTIVRITKLVSHKIGAAMPEDFRGCVLFTEWRDLIKAFSHLEKRTICSETDVTFVSFEYEEAGMMSGLDEEFWDHRLDITDNDTAVA